MILSRHRRQPYDFAAGGNGRLYGIRIETAVGIVEAHRAYRHALAFSVDMIIYYFAARTCHHVMVLMHYGLVSKLFAAQSQFCDVALSVHQRRRHMKVHVY